MVRGLQTFRDHFQEYPDSYVIIGGTACDIILTAQGLVARATKDIDIILIVEALTPEFVAHFWEFVKQGDYEKNEQEEEQKQHYRFQKPKTPDFPFQVELLARQPDVLELEGAPRFTPIPAGEDLSSLSAILMDDNYYHYTRENCTEQDGLQRANPETIIILKAKAFLDLTARKAAGQKVNSDDIKKHRLDPFRIALTLPADARFPLPESIKTDLQQYTDIMKENLPDQAMFKAMGAGTLDVQALFNQLLQNFELNA